MELVWVLYCRAEWGLALESLSCLLADMSNSLPEGWICYAPFTRCLTTLSDRGGWSCAQLWERMILKTWLIYTLIQSLRSQNSGLLVVPRIAKSTKGGRTFTYLAPKLWNSLPDNVRGSDTLSLFKSRLKTHLLAKHSYNASHNLVLQVYLIKRTLLCFRLGLNRSFLLDGTTATLIMSLFVSLFLD